MPKKKPPSDHGLVGINVLAGNFENYSELKSYCDSQYHTIVKAEVRIKELEAQVKHLQELLTSTTQLVDAGTTNTEQLICEIQINKLKKTAMDRELTLEETKRLDLLVKNLYLIKSQNEVLPADFSNLGDITEAELIQIAATKPEPKESE